ncbi:probable RNA-dependent RNA polymerase 5 isoform X2 [Humulus lupulus]|uniref:probable RNA-dependent RNA polymerase 5 isoform X2 n=1 Tax=Humulus lupulus TaxID=3486 RepID=UPI002B405C05|nr:probable RNA-dependent RNA polymerase 5 isoform X2 [Humulus lupulus]
MDDLELGTGVPLPRSVEEMLERICLSQNLAPADDLARRKLAAAGEELALEKLRRIANCKVKNLSKFIMHMLSQSRSPSQSPPPPRKRNRIPDSHSPTGSPSCSPNTRRVCLFKNPRGGPIPCSLNAETETETSRQPREMTQAEAALEALGELEFNKQFLILNYTAGNELHKVATADDIRKLKHLTMVRFEAEVWRLFGQKYVKKEDRRMYDDWDDERRTYIYDCYVSTEGSYRFKGPFLSNTKTHLQKVLGDDNILRVKFAEEANENSGIDSHDHYFAGYRKIAREGIKVGLRRYCFFVFKDGGNQEKRKNPNSSPVKCFFIRIHSDAQIDQKVPYCLSNKTISEARKLFMHAHTVSSVANYMARFSLILSKTYSLNIDLSSVDIDIIEDKYCVDEHGKRMSRDEKPLIHTDGTGFISADLAVKCPKNLHEGRLLKDEDTEILLNLNCDEHEDNVMETIEQGIETQEPPMLMQFRLFNNGYAVKGTFLVSKMLEPKTIKIRHSMVKVVPDPELKNIPTKNSLEVIGTSNRPKKAYFSRNLIALLSYGGVPNRFFIGLLRKALKEAHGAFRNKSAAMRVAMNRGVMDKDSTVERMISCGIPLEEPYLQHRLSILLKEQKLSLRGGKLCADDSYYLMGTADPTGKLKSDEVCIVLDNGQVSGKVLVYRNPGVHFGDVHVLKATYVEELESFVGNAKYAIFFSRKGPRSIADEIAGGDFDGDMYWISRNPELLQHFKPSEPWSPNPSIRKVEGKTPTEFSDEDLEDELFKLFLTTRFKPSYAMGEAADSLTALMDRVLTLGDDCAEEKTIVKDKISKLVDIYYDALDAPKKGAKVEVPKDLKSKSFPHYMEKRNSYTSTSILGKIYDEVIEYQAEDHSSKEIWKLAHFEVDVPRDCLNRWSSHYEEYRKEMTNAMKNDDRDVKNQSTNQIKRKYKMILYEAEEFEDSKRNIDEIHNEALAIYHLSYDYAKSRGGASYCSFAWSVAGPALYNILISKQAGEKAIQCLPSVLRELI